MSRIDELITELCPNGVPVHRLGEIATMLRGNGMPKTMLLDAGVGAIHYGQIYTKYGTWAEETLSFVSDDDAKKLTKAEPGDLIITNTSENLEDVGKAVAWLGESQIVTGGHATVIKHKFEPKFLAYWFQTPDFYMQKKKLATGTKVIDVSAKKLEQVIVPVPPLEIQREIVRILDTFSKMEAELEAELEARKQQYEHYRAGLFGSMDLAETLALSDIAEFKYGYTTKATDSGAYRFIRITDISDAGTLRADGAKFIEQTPESDLYLVQPDDLLMARTGATFGKTVIVKENQPPAVYASFLIRVRFSGSRLLPSYYWHFAQSTLYWDQANALVSSGGQPQFNANALKKVRVPIPDIIEQRRIVEILDKFDALVNDLSVGLPAELAARRQQYEYYRDKLLTFKELEPAV